MTTNINKYKKILLEVTFSDMRGLSSKPHALIPPDSCLTLDNFYINRDGSLKSREAAAMVGRIPSNATLSTTQYVEMAKEYVSLAGTTTYCIFTYNDSVGLYNQTTGGTENIDNLLLGGTTVILNSSSDFKDITSFQGYSYIVDGTSQIIKWDGADKTISTTLEVPESGTYGNPVSIENIFGSIFVITDKNYLRYTGVGTDDVWEERTLMGGTVAITAGTTYMTGTETIFTQAEVSGSRLFPQAGQKMYLTQAASTEYLTISSVRSTTEIFTVESATEDFTDATWYLKGIDFYEPLSPDDGLKARMIRKFSNRLAVTRTEDDPSSSRSTITYLNLEPIQNTNILKISQRDLGEGYDVHPYSLFEYEDNLGFVASKGIYLAGSANEYNNTQIKPINISIDKLDNELSSLNVEYKTRTRVCHLKNKDYNLILVQVCNESGNTYNSSIYAGYNYTDGSFEFSKIFYDISVQTGALGGEGSARTFSIVTPYKDVAVLLNNWTVFEIFDKDQTYPVDTSAVGGTVPTKPLIDRTLTTGHVSISSFNYIVLNKSFSFILESVSNSAVVAGNESTFNQYKIYLHSDIGSTNPSLVDYTRTAEDGYDNTISLFCNSRSTNNVYLKIDSNSTLEGFLDFRKWGITLKQGKFG